MSSPLDHSSPDRRRARTTAHRRGWKRRTRTLARLGWLPDQHGAWPIALVPLFLGILDAGWTGTHALLIGAWICAFAWFSAFETWRRTAARRHRDIIWALVAWTVGSAAFGVPLLWSRPSALMWAPLFLPLVLVALWEIWRGYERAILTRITSICASSLMTPVASWYALEPASGLTDVQLDRAWINGALVCLYFTGTVPFVRSLIRGRSDARWMWAAFAWHVIGAAAVAVAVARGTVSWMLALVWAGLIVRTLAMPAWQRHRVRPLPPLVIGLSEMAWCTVVTLALVWPV